MGCERCGGRMLSRSGGGRGLVCSDCGGPVSIERQPHSPHPLGSAALLLGFGAFSVLLFFLTNWHPRAPERASERGMLQKVTTGAFVEDAQLMEKGSHNDE